MDLDTLIKYLTCGACGVVFGIAAEKGRGNTLYDIECSVVRFEGRSARKLGYTTVMK